MADVSKKTIAKAEKGLMSPKDVKEDMMLVLGPHMNWQEMLCPAPLSVCLLGQLVLVTLDKDVSLVSEHMTRDRFKHTEYPESLRTSILQVADEGWNAFNLANKNMDQIRLLTLQIPQHVKNAVKYIVNGSEKEVRNLVPDYLANIKRITDTCVVRAEEVETRFCTIMDLIGELQKACTFAEGHYSEKLLKAEKDHEVKTLRMKSLEERKQLAEEEYNELRDQFKKAQKSYQKAMNSMPSGWSMIGMDFVEGLAKCTLGVCQSVSNAITKKAAKKESSKDKQVQKEEDKEALLMMELPQLSHCVKTLVTDFDQIMQGTEVDHLMMVEATFQDIVQALKSYSGVCKQKVNDIVDDGYQLIRKMKTAGKQLAKVQSQEKDAKLIAGRLEGRMKALETFCAHAFGQSLQTPTPMMSTKEQDSSSSASAKYSEQCRFQVEQTASSLESIREDFKSKSKSLQETNAHVTSVIEELAHINLDKVNFDEIKQLLQRGIKALGQVRTQWGKLVRFFTTISNIIKCSMDENVKNFVQGAERGAEFRLEYTMSDMMRDMIYVQASEANKLSYMVNNLAEMYVEVSEKHLMDQVASLGELLALGGENDTRAVTRKMSQLNRQAQDATVSIGLIVAQKQLEFDTKVQRRIERIQREMKAVLPPPPPEDPTIKQQEKKAIKEAEKFKAEHKVVDEDDWA
ncbi:uncharacterized protein LOC124144794 [Haliotis rufescens]|uniref:uncharacterized protein LOC124144794 n=1 Tax=Haliotis rufescens TaxID=6454 RepID=UPI00201E846E|nr:uncharacterized protein LOC124144794 [Haliotis rufescens]XP_046370311.2 uncharacterized protein LOC124144794 [Haliotis rufescens]XP_046370312.2 uncharacterized protein LOC124144794 [Haliotis rufescens]